MAGRFRSSKFRHVYGAQTRREQTFENIRITRNTHDSSFCSVNPQFVAVVLESSGGGSFAVLDVNRPGRVDINCPKVCGHSGSILDIKWNPFNDNIIASAADDATVKLWTIPNGGITNLLTDWTADLHGHSRKVAYLEWHPTAANILMSVALDYKVMVWNVEQAEPVTSLSCHSDTIYSVSWGRDGSLIASTSKDKKIRVLDPRTSSVVMETMGHESAKPAKIVFVRENHLFTSGFSRGSNRQYALWDMRKAGSPIYADDLDCSSGNLLPFFDADNNIVYLAGKGDGLIRYFEIVPDSSAVHYLNSYQSPLPQRGLAMMPKRGLDTSKNEITRFYKLHASKNLVEPISMIVPRKAEGFQNDIYPPTASMIPSCTADEWTSGVNRGPILLNLEDGTILDKPKSSMSPAVQPQMGILSKAPQITTYKALSKTSPSTVQPRTATSNTNVPSASHTAVSHRMSYPLDSASETTHNGNERYSSNVPSSIKNIRRLSMSSDERELSNVVSGHSAEPHMSVSMTTSLFNGFSEQNQNQVEHRNTSSSPPVPRAAPRKRFGRNASFRSKTVGENSSEHISAIKFVLAQAAAGNQPNAQEKPPDPDPEPYYAPSPVEALSYGRSPPLRSNTVGESSNEHVSAVKLVLGQPSVASQPNPEIMTATQSEQTHKVRAAPRRKRFGRNAPQRSKTLGGADSEHVNAIKVVLERASEIAAQSNPSQAIHVRKVWSPPATATSPTYKQPEILPGTDPELKKAYFRQLEEIRSLQEQIQLKDKRIKLLETELSQMKEREADLQPGESNC